MGVSIYYTARRPEPLSATERSALRLATARYPLDALIAECGVGEDQFNGESFCVYPSDTASEPDVVFEGATKLPLCSDTAVWTAIQYWCRLLSEIHAALPGTAWNVHVDDHDIPWVEELRAFDPSV